MYSRRPMFAAASKFAATLLVFGASLLPAQTASFSYAQTTVPTGLKYLYGVAVDGAGNSYVADLGNQRILKVPAGGGTPVTIATGYPFSNVAVDASGNVFATARGVATVIKIPSGGGSAVMFGSNFKFPEAVQVDKNGNVYVIDFGGSSLWKIGSEGLGAQSQITVPGMSVPQNVALDATGNVFVGGNNGSSSTISVVELPANGGQPITVATGLSPNDIGSLGGFAVDSAGNVFTTNPPNDQIMELPAGGGSTIHLGAVLATSGLAVDAQNNVFAGDTIGLVELQRSGGVNFGNVNACAVGQTTPAPCSETAILYYTVTASGTLGTPKVNGSSDFALASGSTCTGGVTAGSTCTVNITFTPSAAGLRSGNVQIVNGSGAVLATTSISGNGIVTSTVTFINGQTLGPLRNNYSGFVGFVFTTGATPIQISSLGRYVAPGDTSSHLLKLVQATGVDLPGGSATVSTSGVSAGQYAYAPLASPITLPANTTDYLVSQESAGGDQWYDYGAVTSTSAATVLGPVYTDSHDRYYAVSDFSSSYVPLNFLYAPVNVSTLSVSITAPSNGGLLSGTSNITVSTTGAVASLQLQVDGISEGPAVSAGSLQGPPYTLSLDTTLLVNGAHTLTVLVSDAQLNTVTSPGVTVTISNAAAALPSFVTGESLNVLRNNYSGFVGFAMTTGNAPVAVSFLGRFVAPNNSGTHLLKLVNSNGTDVPGGSVTVSLAGATQGTFSYGALSTPVTLAANTAYFVLSQETAGADQWYDISQVSTTIVAAITAPVYSYGSGSYYQVPGLSGKSYVPVSFLYGSNALSVSITSPQAGAVLSGNNIPVAVATTGSFTGLQLQVDGVNQGAAVSAGPLTLNTTTLTNGAHTLTVLISQGTTASAVSAGVIVTVNNGGATPASFITGETPSALRNDYSGFVGTVIQVGSTPLSVTSLGRFFAAGNGGVHTVKLVQSNGADVPGGSVAINMAGGTAGQFVYSALASPVALLANTTYYVVSQESVGGDKWYDLEPVTGTAVVQILGATYTDGHGNYYLVGGLPGYSYVPVSFKYQ